MKSASNIICMGKSLFSCLTAFLVLLCCLGINRAGAQAAAVKPNFIIIFTDDQGYGDLGC